MERSTALSSEKVKSLLQCPRCLTSPMTIPIYSCQTGHAICNSCYEDARKNLQKENPPQCTLCFSELTSTRNLMAEQLVQALGRRSSGCSEKRHIVAERDDRRNVGSQVSTRSCSSRSSSCSSSCSDPVSVKLGCNEDDFIPMGSIDTESQSHRPIRCPKSPCSCTVAVASLTAHFTFDHPDVPMLMMDPGVRNHLWISPEAFPLEMSRCIALLLLSGQCRNTCKNAPCTTPTIAKLQNRIPLPLMAVKTRSIGDKNIEGSGDSQEEVSMLVWVTDVDATLVCNLEVCNGLKPDRNLMTTCNVVSLREPQIPRSIYRKGNAIILHSSFLSDITQVNGGYDLYVRIM